MASAEWSRTTKRLVIVGLIILLLLILYLFRTLLAPIILAVVLAYLLKPFADLIERRAKFPRTLAVLLVFLVLLLIIATIPFTVVPYAVDRITNLNLDLQQLVNDLVAFLSQPIIIVGYRFSLQELVGNVQGTLQSMLQPFATQTVGLLVNVVSSVIWVIAIFVVSFYLVRDADRLRRWLDRVSPPGYTEEFRHLREEINQVWKAFFRGQVLLGLVIGVATWIAMTAVGLPLAGLMGLLAGLLEVIPNFGPVLATIPALFIAFFRGSSFLPLSNFWFAVLVLGIYVLIQQVENVYLKPRIMGRRMGLHPVLIFIGILAGGVLFGILGILLVTPVLGTLRVVLHYVYAKLLNQDPFPPEFAEAGELYPGEIDAILFDLDGTLVQTDDAAVERLTRRLQPLRRFLPKRDPARAARRILMALEGPTNSLVTLLDRLGLDDRAFAVGDRLRRMRGLVTPPDFRPVDGVVDMLGDLSHRYHLAIVTTRSRAHAEIFIQQQNLDGLFQVIIGREDTWRVKPHPSPIEHAAEKLGVPVERCLMVGDTTVDILAARAAGAWAIGVLCGFGREGELKRAGASLTLQTTSELGNWM
jgi:predicted PurR-regulated permease PerM/phosphoglycolate phosphatase-like HAD superfamily hydrolase